MTEAELVAIVTGIAPAIKDQVAKVTADQVAKVTADQVAKVTADQVAKVTARVDDLVRELTTVREALRAAEGRRLDLEARCAGLEQALVERLLELEARIATVRP